MLLKNDRKKRTAVFAVSLILVLVCFAVSVIKTQAYNSVLHHEVFAGQKLSVII